MKTQINRSRRTFESLESRRMRATLANGAEVADSFSAGGSDAFSFSVSPGDTVRVAVGETGSLDAEPYLQVLAPDGSLLDYDYPGSAGDDAAVQFHATQGGVYTAVVSDYGNNEAMSYRIRAAAIPGDWSLIAGRDAALSNGEEVAASLPVGGFSLFEFDADAGDTTLVMVGEIGSLNAEPYLQVIAPDGSFVDYDYPGSAGDDAAVQFRATQAGTYTAIVTDYGNNEAMDFLIRAVAAPGSSQMISGRDAALSNAEEVEASLPVGGFSLFEFVANAGDTTLVMVGETGSLEAEPYLQVIAPDGSLVDYDFPGSSGGDAAVQFRATQAGTYTAIVTDYGGNEAMDFRIRAAAVPGSLQLTNGRDARLSNGEEVAASLPVGSFSLFEFDADAGDATLVMVGEIGSLNAEPYLQVIAPDGSLVDYDFPGSSGDDAAVQFRATQTGTYTAIVTDYSGNEAMDFRIRAATVPGSPTLIGGRDAVLSDGQPVASSIAVGGFSLFRFNVAAGRLATVSVAESAGEANYIAEPYLQVIAPDGSIVDYDFPGSSGNDAEIQFRAMQGGTYTAIVTDYSGNEAMAFQIVATGVNDAPRYPTGDYNRDLEVDKEDHSVWLESYGTVGVGLPADGNGDGRVDAADYTVWRDNFGATSIQSGSTASAQVADLALLSASSALSIDSSTPKVGSMGSSAKGRSTFRSPVRDLVSPATDRSLLLVATSTGVQSDLEPASSDPGHDLMHARDAAFEELSVQERVRPLTTLE